MVLVSCDCNTITEMTNLFWLIVLEVQPVMNYKSVVLGM